MALESAGGTGMGAAIGMTIVVCLLIFVRSAWRGTGPAYRLVQRVYSGVGSLRRYRKSGRTHGSLKEIIENGGQPRIERLVRRVIPSLSGWFMPFPTDKSGFHDYISLYDTLLEPYRTRRAMRLLEIGVAKGGSLALWREYFPEDATIFGIDVSPAVQTFPADGGIKVLILDSRDPVAVAGALRGRTFDVIVDDGLHHPDAQRKAFHSLRPYLKPDGLYVIEDVYSFRPDDFTSHGDEIVVYADRSGQSLVVLRPPDSEAGRPPGGVHVR